MVSKLLSIGLLAYFAVPSTAAGTSAQPVRLDLHHEVVSPDTARALWTATNKPHSHILPETIGAHFWYYNFTFGRGSVKSIIDTGSSSPIILRQRWYDPGPRSEKLNKTFFIGFGTTESDGTGGLNLRGNLYRDVVSVPTLSVPDQGFGVANFSRPKGKLGLPLPANPHAVFGFAGGSDFPNAYIRPWFQSLCADGKVPECRFGLAFGTNRKGQQVLGTLDKELYEGELVEAPLVQGIPWILRTQPFVNGKPVQKSPKPTLMDSGTSTIIGPKDQVQEIFKELELTPVETKKTLRGYYACDRKLDFGFQIGGQIINVHPRAMAFQNLGNGTCIAAVEAVNSIPGWIIGQSFFQGQYVDHNVKARTMGFAPLKSPGS